MSLVRRLALAAGAALAAATYNDQRARATEAAHPPEGARLDIDGVRLHVLDRGAGHAVLYLHGNGAMIQEVEATGIVDALVGNHRVIVPDRPGFGHSTRPAGAPWTPERQADLFARMLDELAVSSATVVGHSFGTLVALALAERHPELVDGLVLVSGFYYPHRRADEVVSVLSIPGLGDALRTTVAPLAAKALAPKAIERIFEPNRPTQRFQAQYPVDLAVRPSQIRALAEENGLLVEAARRLAPGYAAITCPTFILAGAGDRIVDTAQHSSRLAREIAGAELHVIEDVGHMLPHVRSDAVLGAIERVAQLGTNTGAGGALADDLSEVANGAGTATETVTGTRAGGALN